MKRKKQASTLALAVTDILLICLSLVVFALFHHVLPRRLEPVSAASESALPTSSAAPAQTEAEAVVTATSYESGGVSVTLSEYEISGALCHVADIYIDNITSLRTAFAEGVYGQGFREHPLDIALRVGAVCAINGDYYGNSADNGVVIRNGVLYRSEPNADVCVLYSDGSMTTCAAAEFDADEAMANAAWQAWCFGPALLGESGEAYTEFTSRVARANPRTAIGCFEPGHYCFVAVDGRSQDSGGMTLAELAAFMESLGCETAYNLDGGKTSVMTFGENIVNDPDDGGRTSSDIIYIAAA